MTYLTPAQVGRQLGKSPRSIARQILAGRLPAVRIGRTFRISQDDLAAYLERARVRPCTDGRLEAAVASHRHAVAERACEQAGI